MNKKHVFSFLLACLFFQFANAQLTGHYENASISEVIFHDGPDEGAITGKGIDGSVGKSMFFNSDLHRSPTLSLCDVYMDLEVSNYTEQDSFTVFVEIEDFSAGNPEIFWEKKFPFSDVAEESIPVHDSIFINFNEHATFNFSLGFKDLEYENSLLALATPSGFGPFIFTTGIYYDANTEASIALRATADGEFEDAANRTFTENADGTRTDFVSAYDLDVALAIFPVICAYSGISDISDLGIEIISDSNGFIEIIGAESDSNFSLNIFDLAGKPVYKSVLNSGGSQRFELNRLASGIYIVSLSNGEVSGSRKIFLK